MAGENIRLAGYGVVSLVASGVFFVFADAYVHALQESQDLTDLQLSEYLRSHPTDEANIFVLAAMGGASGIFGLSLLMYAAFAALRDSRR